MPRAEAQLTFDHDDDLVLDVRVRLAAGPRVEAQLEQLEPLPPGVVHPHRGRRGSRLGIGDSWSRKTSTNDVNGVLVASKNSGPPMATSCPVHDRILPATALLREGTEPARKS